MVAATKKTEMRDTVSAQPRVTMRPASQDFHTKYLAATMAVVLIIGPFFAGHLRPSETTQGRASMLANMRYHTAVIISLFTACGTLASSSRKLMRLGAHAERILELEDTAKEINSGEHNPRPNPLQ